MTPKPHADPRVIIALDYPDMASALAMARAVQPSECRLKVGMELFDAEGPALIDRLQSFGFDVFLDLKFHDIPTTVAHACRVAAEMGVWMMNVHTLGGERMMAAAREAVDAAGQRPLLIGVTVLTSHDADELSAIGLVGTPEEAVMRLAGLARNSGLDGVVCSPREAAVLRETQGADFRLVTPGIRLEDGNADDQRRTMTPDAAIANGADYLVVGRPVTRALDPAGALRYINSLIGANPA